MAATVQASYYGGGSTEPLGASAEGSTMKFNRLDHFSNTSGPIQIPVDGVGTGYSWYKLLALDVTSTGTTNIDNRTIAYSSAPSAGLLLYFASTSGYVQATSTNMPVATTSGDNAVPANYTALTSSAQAYSTESVATSSGRNGGFCKLLLGVASTGTYVGGAGSAIVLPSLSLGYDEA